jgi:DNA-binding transcriptional LysR family regulator
MMGRLIEAWLARQSLRLPQRFELDSYHAILAMVAAGEGWSIITPLGYAAAQRFQGRVSLAPLPGPAMARTVTPCSPGRASWARCRATLPPAPPG